MSKTELTEPQLRIMRAIRDHGTAYVPDMNAGGRDRAYAALLRKGMVRNGALTNEGAVALLELDAAEKARQDAAQAAWDADAPARAEARAYRRVISAAARFLAETDGVGNPVEPTDENLAAAFANVVRPIDPELYPRVRIRVTQIRAERAQKD